MNYFFACHIIFKFNIDCRMQFIFDENTFFSICEVITYDMNKKGADIPNTTYIVLKLIMLDTYCCVKSNEWVLVGNNASIV